MHDADLLRAILARLDLLVRLRLEDGAPDKSASITDMVVRLLDAGLKQAEVAAIVGRKPNYVGAVASAQKRKTNKGGGKK